MDNNLLPNRSNTRTGQVAAPEYSFVEPLPLEVLEARKDRHMDKGNMGRR